MNKNTSYGAAGEEQVVQALRKNGYAVLHTNYRKPYGEIDIIARKDEVIAFVEVKTRTTRYFSLCQVVTPSKQKKIVRTALQYLAQEQLEDVACRFDVALVEAGQLTYIPNAFTAYDGNC